MWEALRTDGFKIFRFGVFELDLAWQLRNQGHELPLQEQPVRLLVTLLEHPGELVTREELRTKLWPTETFLEFDDSLNTAVQKISRALGDDARRRGIAIGNARRYGCS